MTTGLPPLAEEAGTLLSAVAAHDRAAFTRLYQITSRLLYSICLRITRQPDLADDALSETYLQVWRMAQRYEPARGNALAWLTVICRSRALDVLRKRGPVESAQPDRPEFATGELVPPLGPATLLECVAQHNTLHAALALLDEQPRQLLALAYFRGYTHSELANYTGLPLGTVKSQLRSGVEKLRSLMHGETHEQA